MPSAASSTASEGSARYDLGHHPRRRPRHAAARRGSRSAQADGAGRRPAVPGAPDGPLDRPGNRSLRALGRLPRGRDQQPFRRPLPRRADRLRGRARAARHRRRAAARAAKQAAVDASRRCCSTATPTSTSRSRRSPSARPASTPTGAWRSFATTTPPATWASRSRAEGRITALRERSAPLANGGVYWFRPEALAAAPARAGPGRVARGRSPAAPSRARPALAGLVCRGDFIDIGVPHDYHRAASVLPRTADSEQSHAIAR